MKIKNMLLKMLAGSALLLGSSAVPAAIITLNGTNVNFTYDDSLLGLFGAPTVSGDTIYFTPTNIKAISLNGAGSVIASSTVNVVVTAHQGVNMGALSLQERGDYSLSGEGSSVDLGGQLRAFDISNPLNVEDSSFITTSSDLTLNDGKFHNWVGTADIDLSTALWVNTTSINMTLENVLTATTIDFPSTAFIEKKFAGVVVTVGGVPPSEVPVPVPAAAWLFGSGLMGLAGVARRRGKA
jgi:hypothetical protein